MSLEKTKITKCAHCQEEKECDLVHLGLYDVAYLCYDCNMRNLVDPRTKVALNDFPVVASAYGVPFWDDSFSMGYK